MKAVGYLRVSTEEQLAGTGLQGQREAITARCSRSTLGDDTPLLVGWYADEGISGGEGIETRTGLADALSKLAKKEADTIIVYRLDRLARDVVLQEQILQEIWGHGGQLVSCSDIETDYCRADPEGLDPSRKLVRTILSSVAEYEKGMIRLRMKAGLRRHLRDGGKHGHRAPYGWRWDNKQLVPVAYEQGVISTVIVGMAEKGYSTRQIATCLNEANEPGPKGGGWSHVTIAKIIKRAQEDNQ